MYPRLMTDGTVVFNSQADLVAWAERRYLDKGMRRTPADRSRGLVDDASPHWTADLVAVFLAGIGERSQGLLACAVEWGTGTTAVALSKVLESPVYGLGKRFRQLERASGKFAHDLPVPARLTGRKGERALVVDPNFASAYKARQLLRDDRARPVALPFPDKELSAMS